jgi:hypothetical protein
MHKLQRRRQGLCRIRLVDVDLLDIQVLVRGAYLYCKAHHWSVKLIQALPPLLTRCHDIDFLVGKRSLSLHLLDHIFRCIAQAARAASEEGNATVEELGCCTEHD